MPADLGDVANISAGGWHSLALLSDGSVRVWGRNAESHVTNVPPDISNVVQAVAGGWHVGVLRSDGSVSVWGGLPTAGQSLTNLPLSVVDIVSISTSGDHILALRRDGKVFSWGAEGLITTHTVPASVTNVTALYAGIQLNLAIRNDASVVAWGKLAPIPADVTNAFAVSAGWYHGTALKRDGTLTAWTTLLGSPPEALVPPGFTNGVFLASGDNSSMALGSDVPAVAVSLSVTGQVSSDLVIPLPAFDPNGDPFTMRITSLPGSGALYQFASGRARHPYPPQRHRHGPALPDYLCARCRRIRPPVFLA